MTVMVQRSTIGLAAIFLLISAVAINSARAQTVYLWSNDFPRTDFAQRSIDLGEFVTYGRKDSIPPIDNPSFALVADIGDIGELEPVVSIGIDGDFRAYPLRVLLYHEIINDMVGGVPVVVTYCAFCNSGIVFDRRLDGRVLEFGNTGTYRHFGMVMYDKQTQSWWQQFMGEAIIGELLGRELEFIPARIESLARFRERAPDGLVLIPDAASRRPYGRTPYGGYDQPVPLSVARERFPYDIPPDVNPMDRFVIVGGEAWSVDLVRERGTLESGDLLLTWEPGQNSVYDKQIIAEGRDVGNIVVQRKTKAGLEDVRYEVSFAFTFAAFVPDGTLHR